MAAEDRGPSSNLKTELLKEGHAFSFYQVMRLLRLIVHREAVPEGEDFRGIDNVRIIPELSLGFPPADVARVEEMPGDKAAFSVMTTFLGLYGVSSPLPTFYTEDLMSEAAEDESVTRDFLSTINHRLYGLLFRCWTKYRQFLQVIEERNPEYLERLFCLIGMGEKELRQDLPQAYELIRYAGLLTQFPRSTMGLETLLSDAMSGISIEIIPCVKRRVPIPFDQQLRMGGSVGTLGKDTFLGEEIEDRMGKFRIRVGPLRRQEFLALVPGQEKYLRTVFLTRLYVIESLEYDIELVLAPGEVSEVRLGASSWSRLGWDTWVFSGQSEALGEVSAVYRP